MTLTLSPDQLGDLQADLDIGTTQTVFTDDELTRLYNRAGGDYTRTVFMALRQLYTSSSKFVTYTEGQTQEARSDRFKQVEAAMLFWQEQWISSNQAQMVHVRSVPTRHRDRPFTRAGVGWRGNGWGGSCNTE